MEQWFAPTAPSVVPDATSVLVLAPHPDDEIFGSGGLLTLYRQKSAKIHVQVLTDGAGYHPSSSRDSVFEKRRQETNDALSVLGLESADFSGYADRSLVTLAELPKVIHNIMEHQAADLVLVPSLWEIHPDHLATARATLAAAFRLCTEGKQVPTLFFYETGAPLRVDCLIDITSVWKKKQRAMQCFTSQLEIQNYARHIEALNIYRTYTLSPSVQYAEAYGVLSPRMLHEYADAGGSLNDRVMDRWVDAALAAATAHAEALQADLVRERKNRSALKEQLLMVQTEAQDWKNQTQRLMLSSSWRLTAPLRKLSEFLRPRG